MQSYFEMAVKYLAERKILPRVQIIILLSCVYFSSLFTINVHSDSENPNILSAGSRSAVWCQPMPVHSDLIIQNFLMFLTDAFIATITSVLGLIIVGSVCFYLTHKRRKFLSKHVSTVYIVPNEENNSSKSQPVLTDMPWWLSSKPKRTGSK